MSVKSLLVEAWILTSKVTDSESRLGTYLKISLKTLGYQSSP